MKTTLSLLSLIAALAILPDANAATVINVNILGGGSAAVVTNPGYGLWDQGTETWNTSAANSVTNVVDSEGAATTVDYAITSTGAIGNQAGADGFGPDLLTRQGKFGPTDSINTLTLTLSGLELNTNYELITYFAANNPNETQLANGLAPVNFTGSTTTIGGPDAGQATYLDGFDDDAAKLGSHFYYYSSVNSGATGQITIVASGPNYETFTGFQLSVPEPSSALLSGVGLLALLRRRR